MPYVAASPELYEGKKVGDGSEVAFVQISAKAPSTGLWKQGVSVVSSSSHMLTKGMVIATMTYGQFSQGDGAAIYLSHDTRGIRVMRQRLGQQISVSVIPSGGQGKESAEAYYVID